jgi:hypothetical protein
MSFDTSGSLRITRRSDGLYVVGKGMLIPIDSFEEGRKFIKEVTEKSEKDNGS